MNSKNDNIKREAETNQNKHSYPDFNKKEGEWYLERGREERKYIEEKWAEQDKKSKKREITSEMKQILQDPSLLIKIVDEVQTAENLAGEEDTIIGLAIVANTRLTIGTSAESKNLMLSDETGIGKDKTTKATLKVIVPPEEKFSITSIPYYELVEKVWDECKSHIKALPSNISSFIRNAKTYRLTPESIKKRLEHEKWSPKQIAFCYVAIRIYEDYERTLRSEGAIDFEDMINLAVDTLKKYDDLNRDVYDHILIDEYQDISKQRYELIKTLMDKNPSCKLFCVGDDWQSIMGFAGSNPEFFVHFDKYFDHPAITYLTYNYRSVSSIVETGNDIIKNNKGLQIDKKVVSIVEEKRPIKVFSSLHNSDFKKQYFQQIADHCMKTINELLSNGYTNKDIMVLTRIYKNPIFNERFEEFAIRKKIRYFSVHKSKGLQAKVVIILNVDKGLYGFPCELQSPTILEPARIENNFDKEVEERRLFYVAVTRAKEDVIIYSQNCAHSKFLDEISNHITIEKLTY